MGMFDIVQFQAKCPTCEQPLTEFQSKDGPCTMRTIDPLAPGIVNFYNLCATCDTWIEFNRGVSEVPEAEIPERTLEEVIAAGYVMSTRR